MKKLFCLLLIIVISSASLFATWLVGDVVDDFGDPTGDSYIYTLTEGTVSNLDTTQSKAYVKVLARFSAVPKPRATWTFEVHDYSWDNPVKGFFDASGATIKIKEDDGTVQTTYSTNSSVLHDWNTLSVVAGNYFTVMLSSNQNLKVSISIENTKYSFAIDCTGFWDTFRQVFSRVESKQNQWFYDVASKNTISMNEEFKKYFKTMGIDKKFCLGSYRLVGENSFEGIDLQYEFIMDNEDFEINHYMNIKVEFSYLDNSVGATKTRVRAEDVYEVKLVVGTIEKKLALDTSGSYTWSARESIEDMVELMQSGKKHTLISH
jgi:hypothetical protein